MKERERDMSLYKEILKGGREIYRYRKYILNTKDNISFMVGHSFVNLQRMKSKHWSSNIVLNYSTAL